MSNKSSKMFLEFAGKMRDVSQIKDTLSGEALTKALEVEGYYPPFFEKAIANTGNRAMLKALFEKAERGEDITIVGFGGSITQKAACRCVEDSYSYLVADWFRKKFPEIQVNWHNAGIGATTSVLGIARMKAQVLSFNPDFVIVDFTTNDQPDNFHAGSYEAIIRTLYENKVAFLCIAYGSINNAKYKAESIYERHPNREELHGPVILHNNAPVIDYYGTMWDCYLDADGDGLNGETDVAHWTSLWADYIHPNAQGHKLASNAIIHYLSKVYDDKENITEEFYFPEKPYDMYTDNFMGAEMYEYDHKDIEKVLTYKTDGITNDQYVNNDSTTKYKWHPWTLKTGEYMEFTVTKAKMFAIMRVVSKQSGTAEIYINDVKVETDCSRVERTPLNWMKFIKFFDGQDINVKILCTSDTYYITSVLIAQE